MIEIRRHNGIRLLLVALIACACDQPSVTAPLAVLPPGTTASGNWSGAVPFDGVFNFTLMQSGDSLTGTWSTTVR
jgi:hypothetical protein